MLRLAANFLRVRACSKIFRRQLFRYFLHDGVKFALLRHLLMLWHSHFALPFVKVTFGALIRLYAHLRQRVLLLARQIRLCDQNIFLYSILVEMSAVRSVFPVHENLVPLHCSAFAAEIKPRESSRSSCTPLPDRPACCQLFVKRRFSHFGASVLRQAYAFSVMIRAIIKHKGMFI